MDVLQKNGHTRAHDQLSKEAADRWMRSSAVMATLSVGMLIAIVAMGSLLSHEHVEEATAGATELSSASKPDARNVK